MPRIPDFEHPWRFAWASSNTNVEKFRCFPLTLWMYLFVWSYTTPVVEEPTGYGMEGYGWSASFHSSVVVRCASCRPPRSCSGPWLLCGWNVFRFSAGQGMCTSPVQLDCFMMPHDSWYSAPAEVAAFAWQSSCVLLQSPTVLPHSTQLMQALVLGNSYFAYHDDASVTICPFYSSRAHIKPSEYVPIWWAFLPPDPSELWRVYQLGQKDARAWVIKNHGKTDMTVNPIPNILHEQENLEPQVIHCLSCSSWICVLTGRAHRLLTRSCVIRSGCLVCMGKCRRRNLSSGSSDLLWRLDVVDPRAGMHRVDIGVLGASNSYSSFSRCCSLRPVFATKLEGRGIHMDGMVMISQHYLRSWPAVCTESHVGTATAGNHWQDL